MDFLKNLGVDETEVNNYKEQANTLGLNEDQINFIGSISNKVEDVTANRVFKKSVGDIEDAYASKFGVQNLDKKKASDFIIANTERQIADKVAEVQQQFTAKIADYEQKLKDKGIDENKIREEIKASFAPELELISQERDTLKKELDDFKSAQAYNESKSLIISHLPKLEGNNQKLVDKLTNEFVENLVSTYSEFHEQDGELYVLTDTKSLKSVNDLIAKDEILSDFVKKEGSQQQVQGGVKFVKSQGSNQFANISDFDEKEQAIEVYLHDKGLTKGTREYTREYVKLVNQK